MRKRLEKSPIAFFMPTPFDERHPPERMSACEHNDRDRRPTVDERGALHGCKISSD